MVAKGQPIGDVQRYKFEIGTKLREVTRIARLAETSRAKRERAIQLGNEIRELRVLLKKAEEEEEMRCEQPPVTDAQTDTPTTPTTGMSSTGSATAPSSTAEAGGRVHLTECLKAMYPEHPDYRCTCLDWSPE